MDAIQALDFAIAGVASLFFTLIAIVCVLSVAGDNDE